MPKKKQKKRFLISNSKVALHILRPSFVCKLPHECEDITTNAWRPPLNAQGNIDYNILYIFKLPSKSIISLLFGELSNINYFFTFLGMDSQFCLFAVMEYSSSLEHSFSEYSCSKLLISKSTRTRT